MKFISSSSTYSVVESIFQQIFDQLCDRHGEVGLIEDEEGIRHGIDSLRYGEKHIFGDFRITFFEIVQRNVFLKDYGLLLCLHLSDHNSARNIEHDPHGLHCVQFVRVQLFIACLNDESEDCTDHGPTVFSSNELLSVDYCFNQGKVARHIMHNKLDVEDFPNKSSFTACPATLVLVRILRDLENGKKRIEVPFK